MRVLITGPSGISCSLGNKLDIISNISSLHRAHLENGDSVERRPVVPGEDLDRYDRVYAIQQTIASWVAPYALGFLYTVGLRRDAIICFDDWQAPDSFKLGNYAKERDCAWNPKLNRKYQEEAEKVSKIIDYGIEILCLKTDRKYLLPVFIGGNYNNITCNGIRVPWSPYPFMREYKYTSIDGRKYAKVRRWINASLQDNTRWVEKQGFIWPTLNYGVKKLGQERVTEEHLARIYASSWGVLSPPHRKLEGTGWYRVRVPMAVGAGSILYGSPLDVGIATNGMVFSRAEIEDASDSELQEFAAKQKAGFGATTWTENQLIDFIKGL